MKRRYRIIVTSLWDAIFTLFGDHNPAYRYDVDRGVTYMLTEEEFDAAITLMLTSIEHRPKQWLIAVHIDEEKGVERNIII